jgi:hypothetical protein
MAIPHGGCHPKTSSPCLNTCRHPDDPTTRVPRNSAPVRGAGTRSCTTVSHSLRLGSCTSSFLVGGAYPVLSSKKRAAVRPPRYTKNKCAVRRTIVMGLTAHHNPPVIVLLLNDQLTYTWGRCPFPLPNKSGLFQFRLGSFVRALYLSASIRAGH